jgi:thiol-disulfide isomerase/thioredoxin
VFNELRPDGSIRDWGFLEMRGRLLLVTFWATWCPVCAGEMPKLDALQAELGDEGLGVIPLSIDESDIQRPAHWLRRQRLNNLRIFHDADRALYSTLGLRGIPTSLLAGPDGRVIGIASGAVPWTSPDALRYLRAWLRHTEGPRPDPAQDTTRLSQDHPVPR